MDCCELMAEMQRLKFHLDDKYEKMRRFIKGIRRGTKKRTTFQLWISYGTHWVDYMNHRDLLEAALAEYEDRCGPPNSVALDPYHETLARRYHTPRDIYENYVRVISDPEVQKEFADLLRQLLTGALAGSRVRVPAFR